MLKWDDVWKTNFYYFPLDQRMTISWIAFEIGVAKDNHARRLRKLNPSTCRKTMLIIQVISKLYSLFLEQTLESRTQPIKQMRTNALHSCLSIPTLTWEEIFEHVACLSSHAEEWWPLRRTRRYFEWSFHSRFLHYSYSRTLKDE